MTGCDGSTQGAEGRTDRSALQHKLRLDGLRLSFPLRANIPAVAGWCAAGSRAGRRRPRRGDSATGSETCRREQRLRPQRPGCVIGSKAAALRPSSTASAGFSRRGQHPLAVAANSATGSGTGWQRAAAQTFASRQRHWHRNPPAKAMPIIGGGRHWFEHHPAMTAPPPIGTPGSKSSRRGQRYRPSGAGSATSGHQAAPGHRPPEALPPNLPSSIAPATASRLRHWIKNRQCGRPRR